MDENDLQLKFQQRKVLEDKRSHLAAEVVRLESQIQGKRAPEYKGEFYDIIQNLDEKYAATPEPIRNAKIELDKFNRESEAQKGGDTRTTDAYPAVPWRR